MDGVQNAHLSEMCVCIIFWILVTTFMMQQILCYSDLESVLCITDISAKGNGAKFIDTHMYVCVLASNILPNQSSVHGIWVGKLLLTCVAIWLFPEG